MSRKDLVQNCFPEEYHQELLEILEDVGFIEEPAFLANYFGVSKLSIKGFLQTKEAKTAAALATPATRKAWLENFALSRTEGQDRALPDNSLEDGMQAYDLYTGEPVFNEADGNSHKPKHGGCE